MNLSILCAARGARCSSVAAAALTVMCVQNSASARQVAPVQSANVASKQSTTPRRGLFTVRHSGTRLLFEIPRSELNRDMVIVRTVASGTGLPGRHFVRWQRRGNQIWLRRQVTLGGGKHAGALESDPIIATFEIESFGADSASIIDATRLFTTNIPEFVGVRGLQSATIDRVTTTPDNVNVLALQTGTASQEMLNFRAGEAHTASIGWSILKLPETPMMPRLYDPRVYVMAIDAPDRTATPGIPSDRQYVLRFRLEKKDPAAEVSDVVKPIVFWIDPATPSWLVPYVKAGVADWLPAFEEAGFRNAVVAREPPSAAQNPDWSFHDARNSLINWNESDDGAPTGGPTLVDPRSGEIIAGSANMPGGYLKRMRYQYLAQAGSLDAGVKSLAFPDSLLARLLQRVIAHEVGHAFGLQNFDFWTGIPIDSLRSAAFLRREARHVPTIMGTQYNYVAQATDSIPADLLVARVGPLDRFYIKWQSKPVPSARLPEAERQVLDSWVRQQNANPWLRLQPRDAMRHSSDAAHYEDILGVARLAVPNVKRVANMLASYAERADPDAELLMGVYETTVQHWTRIMTNVAALVGGMRWQESRSAYEMLNGERQRTAVAFLVDNAFHTPEFIVDPRILSRIEKQGAVNRIGAAQSQILNTLLSDDRIERMVEQNALKGATSTKYTPADLFTDVRRGIWAELNEANPQIDPFRRNLQRSYLQIGARKINPSPAQGQNSGSSGSDLAAIMRAELTELHALVVAARTRTRDQMTRVHLQDVANQIERILAGAQ